MTDLVSVIVPAYNAEETIKRCVDSVLGQTYGAIELILVNDGSTDKTGLLCGEYAAEDSRVRVIHQENLGVSAARNRGIDAATGTYLTFLDADDELFPNAISAMVQRAALEAADMVFGRLVYCGADQIDREERRNPERKLLEKEQLLLLVLADDPYAYSACRILYRCSFLQNLRFVPGRIVNEDSFFVFQCALKEPRADFIEEPVYRCRYHCGSVSHRAFTRKKYEDILYFLERKRQLIAERKPEYADKMCNLVVKCHMNLLQNMRETRGPQWRERKRTSLRVFHSFKGNFVPQTKQDRRMFFVLNHHLYGVYCAIISVKNRAVSLWK